MSFVWDECSHGKESKRGVIVRPCGGRWELRWDLGGGVLNRAPSWRDAIAAHHLVDRLRHADDVSPLIFPASDKSAPRGVVDAPMYDESVTE